MKIYRVRDWGNDFVGYTDSLDKIEELKKWAEKTYNVDSSSIKTEEVETDLILLYKNLMESYGY